ncbi:MAG TPA: hypothetical protein VEW04_08495 [Allosphingosinicella sp.]|nr:hypothetical protein [Allosphingosinicella sp.]
MQTNHPHDAGLIALGSVSADTLGQGGVILEVFTLMPKAGITND